MPPSQAPYPAIKHGTIDVLFASSPALAGGVQHGMVKSLPGGAYVLPAGMHPIILVILRGEIRVCRGNTAAPGAASGICCPSGCWPAAWSIWTWALAS